MELLLLLALIVAIVVALAAFFTGLMALFAFRTSNKLKQQNTHPALPKKPELDPQPTPEQESLIRESKRQQQQAALAALQQTQNIERYADSYRQKLRSDPHMAELKILTMAWPLDLASMYVQLVLHQQDRPEPLDPALLKAEATHEPNQLLRMSRLQVEALASTGIDPDLAIRVYRHCIIVGDPGAGKTTLLKYLALRCAARQLNGLSDLPIHIDLNAFASSAQDDLLAFAAQNWEKDYDFPQELARAYIEQNMQNGNALLLLDALDETLIGNSKEQADISYRRVTNSINQVAASYPQVFIVVTARIAAYRQQIARLHGFIELRVLDFRPKDIEQFIQNWFLYHPQRSKLTVSANDLNERLKRTPRIQSLVSNPLLLALVVLIYEERQELPTRRSDLYSRCVEIFLFRWDTDRSRGKAHMRLRQFEIEHKQRLLKKVAWHFHKLRKRYFPDTELLGIIRAFLTSELLPKEQAQEVLNEIAAENGLLREEALRYYAFLHLTLQEYFAAQSIDEEPDGFSLLLTRVGNAWWEEVFLLYAGLTPAQSQARLLRELLVYEDEDHPGRDELFHTYLILAGRCLAAHPRGEVLWKSVTEALFQLLMETTYALTRRQTAEALAELHTPAINQRLLEMLMDQSIQPDIQVGIIEAFGVYGEASVVDELAQMLANEQIDVELRMRMAQTLGKLGLPSPVPKLVTLLSQRLIHSAVRSSIAFAIGQIGVHSVSARLVELLSKPEIEQKRHFTQVRCSIADALGVAGDRSVMPELRRLHDNSLLDFSIRWHITVALAALGEPEVITDLLPILADEKYSKEMRREIAEALGALRLRSYVLDLLPMLADEQIHWEVRVGIANALGAAGERDIMSTLLGYFVNEDINEYVRVSIGNIIGAWGEPQILSKLRTIHIDEQQEPRVYRCLITTMGKLGDATVIDDLVAWLHDRTLEIAERLNMLEAFSMLSSPSLATDLINLLANRSIDRDIRRGIVGVVVPLLDDASALGLAEDRLRELLPGSDIADDIHQALWALKRRLW